MDQPTDRLDRQIGCRVRDERRRQELSLAGLAQRSGVSRAMISKIERGEASATAALLGRLCAGLGINLTALFAPDAAASGPLVRHADQPVWRDPGSGYLRRTVSPQGVGSSIEITEVLFPPKARVAFEVPWLIRGIDQQVWVLDGVLELTIGEEVFRLETGDCVHKRLDRPVVYHNPTDATVRYAVILTMEERKP